MKTTTAKTEKKIKVMRRNRFMAADKCRAVLALWTERSSGTELCRDLGVTWNQLNLWQEQAMEGMIQALEPKRSAPCGNTPLNPRLQGLLERKAVRKAMETPDPPLPAPKPGRPQKARKPPSSPLLPDQP
jgi:transposase-like protein